MATKRQRRLKTTGKVKRKSKSTSKFQSFNLTQFGLASRLNEDLVPKKPHPTPKPLEWESIPPKPTKPHVLSEFNREYISKLIQKHGPTNVEKMFWDKKLNYDQLTITKLENLIKLYT